MRLPGVGVGLDAVVDVNGPELGDERLALLLEEPRGGVKKRHGVPAARERDHDADGIERNERELGVRAAEQMVGGLLERAPEERGKARGRGRAG